MGGLGLVASQRTRVDGYMHIRLDSSLVSHNNTYRVHGGIWEKRTQHGWVELAIDGTGLWPLLLLGTDYADDVEIRDAIVCAAQSVVRARASAIWLERAICWWMALIPSFTDPRWLPRSGICPHSMRRSLV